MGVGGGRGHEMDGRKKGIGRGAAPFLLKSPRGRFGTVMMGWWCVAGGVVLHFLKDMRCICELKYINISP